jgi:hypothetical protein
MKNNSHSVLTFKLQHTTLESFSDTDTCRQSDIYDIHSDNRSSLARSKFQPGIGSEFVRWTVEDTDVCYSHCCKGKAVPVLN